MGEDLKTEWTGVGEELKTEWIGVGEELDKVDRRRRGAQGRVNRSGRS